MSWENILSSSRIISEEANCWDCQKPYTLTKYTHDQGCTDNKCTNPIDSILYAWVQPYKLSNDESHFLGLSEFGNREKELIKVIYYPERTENIGIRVGTTPCRDRIKYQGKSYKALNSVCVEGMCSPECGGIQCEAIFCLDSCKSDNLPIAEVQDAVEL